MTSIDAHIASRLQDISGASDSLANVDEHADTSSSWRSLASLSQSASLDLERFLALARNLADVVAHVHARGVIHKHISPENVLVCPQTLKVQLVGFGNAITRIQEYPGFEHPRHLRGNPGYLSPEQTGRMNRPVDARSDLYSLGATLYALATGAPPFTDTDPLALIHAHLARMPTPPSHRVAWIPPALDDILLTLLAKEPQSRYQSAAGLRYDLDSLAHQAEAGKSLSSMPLRMHDLGLAPRPPSRLYGREKELATLADYFSRVVHGEVCGVFLAGGAGVGKTRLVGEMHKPITLARGLFVSGKCEQFQSDQPFQPVVQAMRSLCRLLLDEHVDHLEQWQAGIPKRLGRDVAALFALMPELKSLLGEQPAETPLGPRESQTRLRNLLTALIREIASPQQPLVMFLDDLQWADSATLTLVESLLTDTKSHSIMLLGAYRDAEVGVVHPLRALLTRIRSVPRFSSLLSLNNLNVADIVELLADMLQTAPVRTLPLAECLHAKTAGNPFYTLELVSELHRRGLIRSDLAQGRWDWNLAGIQQMQASDNVVDFLTSRLQELPDTTVETLTRLAALGQSCSLGLLSAASGIACENLVENLLPAVEQGMLITLDAQAFLEYFPKAPLAFCHDRMQQATYLLTPEAKRYELHLEMAERLERRDEAESRWAAAEHYAAAASIIADPDIGLRARQRFLWAARQAPTRPPNTFCTSVSPSRQAHRCGSKIRILLLNCTQNCTPYFTAWPATMRPMQCSNYLNKTHRASWPW